MKFIEIVDPFDYLTPAERRALDAAFDREQKNGRDEYLVKSRLSNRALQRGYRVIEKLRRVGSLRLPEPPTPGDWRVWHYRQADWKIDALAAPDAPVRRDLRGSTRESRRQLVMRAERAVEAFRRSCSALQCPWWFRVCAELFAPDPPVTK